MSYILNNEIKFSDSTNIDAFGRLRTSEPYNLFNATNVITSGDTIFESFISGGTLTYNQAKSEVQFNVTGASQRIFREQHGYNYYQPGKSQLVFLTGIFGTGVTNVIKRMGYYNDFDGLYFELSGSTFGVTLRTSTSGVAVDTFIPQTSWNIDTLISGNTLNPSGINLDVSKTNIFMINFQWLGVGRVVFGLDLNGVIVPIHQILNANNKTEVYMKTGNLPIRYEIISNGGTDSTFKQICSSVISEGGNEEFGFVNTVSNQLTTRTFATKQSVISARLANNFSGQANRVTGKILDVELVTTTATVNAYWELVITRGYLNENNLGGTPTWLTLSGTPFEYSVNGTTVTGGVVVDSGFVKTTSQNGESVDISITDPRLFIALNSAGTSSDWIHLVVTPSASSAWSGKLTLTGKY